MGSFLQELPHCGSSVVSQVLPANLPQLPLPRAPHKRHHCNPPATKTCPCSPKTPGNKCAWDWCQVAKITLVSQVPWLSPGAAHSALLPSSAPSQPHIRAGKTDFQFVLDFFSIFCLWLIPFLLLPSGNVTVPGSCYKGWVMEKFHCLSPDCRTYAQSFCCQHQTHTVMIIT